MATCSNTNKLWESAKASKTSAWNVPFLALRVASRPAERGFKLQKVLWCLKGHFGFIPPVGSWYVEVVLEVLHTDEVFVAGVSRHKEDNISSRCTKLEQPGLMEVMLV